LGNTKTHHIAIRWRHCGNGWGQARPGAVEGGIGAKLFHRDCGNP